MLGYGNCVVALLSTGDIDVAAHEVHEARTLDQYMRHPGIVISLRGDMAIGTAPRLFCADRVGHEGAEGLSAEAFRGDRLLLVVEPIAVRVLRAHQDGAGGANRRDSMASDGAVDSQHIDVIAQDLEVVGRPVARGDALVVKHGHLAIGSHFQMAPEARWDPGRVATVTSHSLVAVGQGALVTIHCSAPALGIGSYSFGEGRLFVVIRIAGCDGIEHLLDFPLLVLLQHRALKQPAVLPVEALSSPRSSKKP